MQLFKCLTLTLYQQQHPGDEMLPTRGKQSQLSNWPIEEDGDKKKQRF